MKTLILGLGNPVLGDDGVGWRIAQELRSEIANPQVEIDCVAQSGLSLMERIIGYDRVILIDSITTGRQPPGTVYCFRLDELPNPLPGCTRSSHETTLQTALEVGRAIGVPLPDEIMVVAVEVQRIYAFSEHLSPPVAAAVPQARQRVLEMVQAAPSVIGKGLPRIEFGG